MESVKQPLGEYVRYDTRIGRQLSDYHEIRDTMNTIEILSEYYSRKYKEFHEKYLVNPNPDSQIEDDDMLPMTSVFVNIVMSYGRCFDTAKTQEGKESRRLVKLSRHFLRHIDPVALETHDALTDLRDKFVAHAGLSDLEKHEFMIGLDSEGYSVIRAGDNNYRALTNPNVEIDKIKILVKEVTIQIDRKIDGLLVKAQEELNILDNRPEILVNKLTSQQPITDEDLK